MYLFPKKIFPSNLNNYLLCPFKWKCMNDSSLKPPFIYSIPTFTGKALHLVLYKIFDISQTSIHDRLSKEVISSKFDKAWKEVEKNRHEAFTEDERKKFFGSVEQEEAHKTQSREKLFLYLSNLQEYTKVVPIMLEDWIDCNVGEFFIGSRIDRLDASSSKIKVIDYKTGKLPYENSLDDIIKKDSQMVFNAIILLKRYASAPEVEACLDYISHCFTYGATWVRSRVTEMEHKLLALLRKIKDEKEFSPKKNPLCDWCNFQDTECPLFKKEISK